jgi:two-component system, LuxR family, response regulator FixJ
MTYIDSAGGEIFVVDDDAGVRDALSIVFTLEGYKVTGFSDGAAFLAVAQARTPTCILLDVQLPGRSGLDVLRELNAQQYPAPIFIISGVGDIPMAVEAIRNGALDFIEKPFDGRTVVSRVRNAVAAWSQRASQTNDFAGLQFPGHEHLTAREHDVLQQVATGASNKEAGRTLGISPRTVEVHRARIMEKLGAKNAADLVRIVLGHKRPN